MCIQKRVKTHGWAEESSVERLAYSLNEVAEMIGVSKGHLRNENKRGEIAFAKSSRRTIILASELRRYLAELEQK